MIDPSTATTTNAIAPTTPLSFVASLCCRKADLNPVRSWVLDRGYANFSELRKAEVGLPRTALPCT